MADSKIFTDAIRATPRIQRICDQVQFIVEAKTMMIYKEFLALKYLVANQMGREHYVIQVDVGGSKCLVLDVRLNFPSEAGPIKVVDVKEDQSSDDPIKPF